jgi:hypothetical protein
LPRVGGLDRIRSNPKLAVAIAGGLVLLLAWIAWAIHVASDNGGRAALGVLLAWPALLAALALVSLPFIGGYRLVRRLNADSGTTVAPAADENSGDEAGDVEDETEDTADEQEGEEPEDSEAETSKKG